MCTIAKNETFNSFELTFDGKPSEEVRELLKANGYRWHGMRRIWYGYKDISEQLFGKAEQLNSTASKEQNTGEKKADEPKANATPIKFYYNGIKLGGNGELVKISYHLHGDDSDNVKIYADGYGAQLPRDLFDVENDTDIYTDYFDTDSAIISPAHPLYKFAYYAAKKAEYMSAKRYLKSTKYDRYKAADTVERCKKEIADFEQMTDPGQPTNADLLKVDEMNAQKEAERKAKEEAEEKKRQKNYAFKKQFGKMIINDAQRLYPLQDGAKDYAVIGFSEHPALYEATHDENGTKNFLKCSILAADHILRILDERQHKDRETENGSGWYDKTDFTIYKNGEAVYSGRYDIGDNDGGLIAHVEQFAQWSATHTVFGGSQEKPTDEDIERLAFVEWLKGLQEEDEEIESLTSDSAMYQAYFS